MTREELAKLLAEHVELDGDPSSIALDAPPRRTDRGWSIAVRFVHSPGSYSTTGFMISDGHSDARVRSFVVAVGRYIRANRKVPIHLGHAAMLDAPIEDDAFERVLDDARANLILRREFHNPRLVATIDPERRGHIPVLSNPELDAAIAERPDRVDAYAVYGDWLAQRGDPRGELVAIQIARSTRPDDDGLAQREAELLDTYAYEWLGALAWPRAGDLRVSWRFGFIECLVFAGPTDEEFGTRYSLLDALRWLRTLPNPACLREVELGGEYQWPGNELWGVLAEVGLPPGVRRLAITATKKFLGKPAELSPIYPVLAQLDSLEIGFHELDFGTTLPLPSLTDLALWRVSRANAAALRASRWPRLERLFLWLSNGYEGEHMNVGLAELAWLLDGRSVPMLRHLGLGGTLTAELVAAVAESPLAGQLATLDLSEVRSTAELREVMPTLAHLDLRPPTRQP